MNPELTMLKGYVSDLSEKEQRMVNECVDKLKSLVSDYGTNGLFALALVGAELSDE